MDLLKVLLFIVLFTIAVYAHKRYIIINSNGIDTPIPLDPNHAPIEAKAPNIVLSQDLLDGDNYSLFDIAYRLHKAGRINLIAVVVSGEDSYNMSGKIPNILTEMNIPIIVQRGVGSRVTPIGSHFPDIDKYKNDGLSDTERHNTSGVEMLVNIIREHKNISYITGGHLDTLSWLVTNANELISQNLKEVVLSLWWKDRYNWNAEMNFSRGTTRETPTSEATINVFNNLPNNVELIVASAPELQFTGSVSIDNVKTPALRYFIENGQYYKDGKMYTGDFEVIAWATYRDKYFDIDLYEKVPCRFQLSNYGAIRLAPGIDKNRYYLKPKFGTDWYKQLFIEHLKLQ